MNAAPAITEILGRSEQGMTRPFICRSNSLTYYVKGRYAGQRSLCCEWIASNAAQFLLEGLPLAIPPFCIATVAKVLIEGSARSDARDLGSGPVFASLRIEDVQELNWTSAQDWPQDIMAALLLLDLWLQNEDRSLSAIGGNPNILTAVIPADTAGATPRQQRSPWAYDFNLSFDVEFDRSRFFNSHVFGPIVRQWPQGFRERMEPRLAEAAARLPQWFAKLPDEWRYLHGDESLPVQLAEESVSSVLRLPFTQPDAFWQMP